jgi:calcitonin receptor-like
MVVSLLFLCNIVRVLVIKLRAGPRVGARPSRSVLQAVRATLLLLPLLGLHYLLTPFRPESNKDSHSWQQGYEVLSAVTASFQVMFINVIIKGLY